MSWVPQQLDSETKKCIDLAPTTCTGGVITKEFEATGDICQDGELKEYKSKAPTATEGCGKCNGDQVAVYYKYDASLKESPEGCGCSDITSKLQEGDFQSISECVADDCGFSNHDSSGECCNSASGSGTSTTRDRIDVTAKQTAPANRDVDISFTQYGINIKQCGVDRCVSQTAGWDKVDFTSSGGGDSGDACKVTATYTYMIDRRTDACSKHSVYSSNFSACLRDIGIGKNDQTNNNFNHI